MRRVRACVPAVICVLPVVLTGACGTAPHDKIPHDTVTPQHMALIEHSLRTDGFRQFFMRQDAGRTVGCADRVLGADHHGTRVYLFVACGEWRPPRCGNSDGSNGTFPVVATVSDNVVTWQEPGDGGDYVPSIHHLFPRSLWSAASSPDDESALIASAQANAGCVNSS